MRVLNPTHATSRGISTLLLLTVAFTLAAFGPSRCVEAQVKKEDFLERVDVDGDGASTPGDRELVQWWLDHGGDWGDLVAAAPNPGAAVIDLSQFFGSPSAILTDPIGTIGGSGAVATPGEAPWFFIRGDANYDGSVAVSDALFINEYLLAQGPPPTSPDSIDTNNDGLQDLSDSIYLLNYLFSSGPAMPPPFPNKGLDIDIDSLQIPDPNHLDPVALAISGEVGTAAQLSVVVRSLDSTPQAGVQVNFWDVSGGSAMDDDDGSGIEWITTGSQGVASIPITLSSIPEISTFRATVLGLEPVIFSVTSTPGPAPPAIMQVIDEPFQVPLHRGEIAIESLTVQNATSGTLDLVSVELLPHLDHEDFEILFDLGEPPISLSVEQYYTIHLQGSSDRLGLHQLDVQYLMSSGQSFVHRLEFEVENFGVGQFPAPQEFPTLPLEITSQFVDIECVPASPGPLVLSEPDLPSGYSLPGTSFPLSIEPGTTYTLEIQCEAGGYSETPVESLLRFSANTARLFDGSLAEVEIVCRQVYSPGAWFEDPLFIVPQSASAEVVRRDSMYEPTTVEATILDPTVALFDDGQGSLVSTISGIGQIPATIVSIEGLAVGETVVEFFLESTPPVLLARVPLVVSETTLAARLITSYVDASGVWEPEADHVQFVGLPSLQPFLDHVLPAGTLERGTDLTVIADSLGDEYGVLHSDLDIYVFDLGDGSELQASPISLSSSHTLDLSRSVPGVDPLPIPMGPLGAPGVSVCLANRGGEIFFVDPLGGVVWGTVQLPQPTMPIPLIGEDVDLVYLPGDGTRPTAVFALTITGDAYAIELPSLIVTNVGTVEYDGTQPAARLACDPVVAGDSVAFLGARGRILLTKYDAVNGWTSVSRNPADYDADDTWDASFDEGDLAVTEDGHRLVFQTWSGHAYVFDDQLNQLHILEAPQLGNSITGVDPLIVRYDSATQSGTEARVICAYDSGIVRVTDLDDTIRWTFVLGSTTFTNNIDILVTASEDRMVVRHDDGIMVARLTDGVLQHILPTSFIGKPIDGVDPLLVEGDQYLVEVVRREFDGTARVLIHGVAPSTYGELTEIQLPAGFPPKADVDLDFSPASGFGVVQDRRGALVLFSLTGEILRIVEPGYDRSSGVTGVDFWLAGGMASRNSDEDCVVSVSPASPTVMDNPEDGSEDTDLPEGQDPPRDREDPKTGGADPPPQYVTDLTTSPGAEDTPPPPGGESGGLTFVDQICLCDGQTKEITATSATCFFNPTPPTTSDVAEIWTDASRQTLFVKGKSPGFEIFFFETTCVKAGKETTTVTLLFVTVFCAEELTLETVGPDLPFHSAFSATLTRQEGDPSQGACLLVPCTSTVQISARMNPPEAEEECAGAFNTPYGLAMWADPEGSTPLTAVQHECKDFIDPDLDSSGMGQWTPTPAERGKSFRARLGCGLEGEFCTLGDVSIFVTGLEELSGPTAAYVGDEVKVTTKVIMPRNHPCLDPDCVTHLRTAITDLLSSNPVEWEFTPPMTTGCGGPAGPDGEAGFSFVAKCEGTYTLRATWLGVCVVEYSVGVVRKPEASASYEQPPVEGMTTVADPVLPHNGEFMETEVDLVVPSRGMPFNWVRRYKSRAGASESAFGDNWEFSYNDRLIDEGTGLSHYALFQKTTYALDGTARTGYRSPDGHTSVLRINSTTGNHEIRHPSGEIRIFHGGGPDVGRLAAIKDANGNAMQFFYQDGRLTSITDTLHRTYQVGWQDDRIVSLTDFTGRTVEYSYYEFQEEGGYFGQLRSVRSPVITGTVTGNDFPNGRLTLYRYEGSRDHRALYGNLTAIIRPNQAKAGGTLEPALTVEYGEDPSDPETFDKVISSREGGPNEFGDDAGGTYHFYYASIMDPASATDLDEEVRITVLVDRNGNVCSYYFNKNFSLLKKRVYTGRVPAFPFRLPYPLVGSRGPAVRDLPFDHPSYFHQLTHGSGRPGPESDQFFEWSYKYNKHNMRIEETLPEGNRIVSEYPYVDAENPFIRGNLTRQTFYADLDRGVALDPGLHGGSPPIERSVTYTYEPWTNKVASVRDERGNLPGFDAPSEGGSADPTRYDIVYTFDYQELTSTAIVSDLLVGWGIAAPGDGIGDVEGVPLFFQTGLGDINGDGAHTAGNPIRTQLPVATMVDPDGGSPSAQSCETWRAYNTFGQAISETDALANVYTFDYYPVNDPDGDGTVTPGASTALGGYRKQRTDPEGRTFTVEYYPNGMVSREIDGRGVATDYIRNDLGELIRIVRASAVVGSSGLGEEFVTPLGYETSYILDHNGNRVEILHENIGSSVSLPMFETQHDYDILNNVVRTRRLKDDGVSWAEWEYDYDANENLVRLTKPEGNSESWTYDERDLVDLTIEGSSDPDASKQAITRRTYDKNGNLRFELDAEDHDGDGYPEITEYQYDGWDRLAQVIDAAGQYQKFFYDIAGNRTLREYWGAEGGQTPVRGDGTQHVLLKVTKHDFDERNRRFRERLAVLSAGTFSTLEGPSGAPQDGWAESYLLRDALDRIVRAVNDRGNDRILDYNSLGELETMTTAEHGPGVRSQMTFDRDRGGHIWRTTMEEWTPGGAVETYVGYSYHDALGRERRRIGPSGEATYFWYDSRGFLSVYADALGPPSSNYPIGATPGLDVNAPGNTTRYYRDALGRLTRTYQDLRAGGVRLDEQPRLTHLDPTVGPPIADLEITPSNPDGCILQEAVFDDNSRMTARFDHNGNQTTYHYGHRDEIYLTEYADGTAYASEFDRDHNTVFMTDCRGIQKTSIHDVLGRVVEVFADYPVGLPNAAGTTRLSYEWDGLGRLTYAFDNNDPTDATDDHRVSFEYDGLNNPVQEWQDNRAVDRRFDTMGNVLRVSYGNGHRLDRAYDSMERATTLTLTRPSKKAVTLVETAYAGFERRLVEQVFGNDVETQYGFDASRRPTSIHTFDSLGALELGREYTYDANSHRTTERYRDEGTAALAPGRVFELDSVGRIASTSFGDLDAFGGVVTWASGADDETWILDGANNWTDYASDQGAATYSHGSMNDVTSQTVGGVTTPFSRDDNGNVTEDGTYQYSYDAFGRMVLVMDGAMPVAEYEYDALNRRVVVTEHDGAGSTTTKLLYDGMHAIEERAGPSDVHWNYYSDTIDSLIARETYDGQARVLHWYHIAGTNSVEAVSDESGSIVERYKYSTYGRVEYFDGAGTPRTDSAIGNPFLFQGRRLDSTGLYYYRARQYNPELGRFYQLDPAFDPLSNGNGYTFAGTNPQSYWDPYGERSWREWGRDLWQGTKNAVCKVGEFAREAIGGAAEGLQAGYAGLMSLVLHPVDTIKGTVSAGWQILSDPRGFFERLYCRVSQMSAKELVRAGFRLGGEMAYGGLTSGGTGAMVSTLRQTRKLSRLGNSSGPTRGASSQGKPGCFPAGTLVHTPSGLRPIDEIRVGDRVTSGEVADSIDVATVLDNDCESIQPPDRFAPGADLVAIRLSLTSVFDGVEFEVELLRERSWLDDQLREGATSLFLTLPEIGLTGHAEVHSVRPAVAKGGPGRLVTATMVGSASVFHELAVGESRIRTTGRHRFFSVDRNAWVPASVFRARDRVIDQAGSVQVISAVRLIRHAAATPIFNLEVDGTHTYHVGARGVLVHNTGCPGGTPSRRQRDQISRLRSGEDIHVETVEEARGLLAQMDDLRPHTEEGLMPNPDGGTGNGFGAPNGTYRGDLINKSDPTAPVHDPARVNPDHANNPHYNIRFSDGTKATIIISGGG